MILGVASNFFKAISSILLFSACLLAQSEILRYRITGSVKDEAGAAIKGVTVKLIDKTGNEFQDVTHEDGRYSVVVPAGIFSVSAQYMAHNGWDKYFLDRFEVGDKGGLNLDIMLKVDPNFVRVYGTPVPGDAMSENARLAIKLVELDRLDKATVDQKLIPIWKSVKCDDPSQLYVINYGPPPEVRRRRNLIVGSWGSKCDLSGFRITFVDGPGGRPRTVVWQVPPGAKPPTP